MDAAEDAPAKPEPTTMTSNFRLLAGLTSLMSNLYFSHLVLMSPGGILESSFMLFQNLLSETEQDCNRDGDITNENKN